MEGRRRRDGIPLRDRPRSSSMTTANHGVTSGDDDGDGDYARGVVIERIALDDNDGLEKMSEFCIRSFYDDDDDIDIVEGSLSLSR